MLKSAAEIDPLFKNLSAPTQPAPASVEDQALAADVAAQKEQEAMYAQLAAQQPPPQVPQPAPSQVPPQATVQGGVA